MSTEWIDRLEFDVFLFKTISIKDGIDTINAVKKYMNKASWGINDLLNRFIEQL